MVRNTTTEQADKARRQWRASFDLLSRDWRLAILRFFFWNEPDIGAAIQGIGDDDEVPMSHEARRNYEAVVFGL